MIQDYISYPENPVDPVYKILRHYFALWEHGTGKKTIWENNGINTTTPSYRLQVGENSNYRYVDSSGAWQSSSDVRQKENIRELESGLDKIMAIQGVEYNTIGDDPENHQIGFIAQEMEQVVPEIVSTDSDGYKGIAYAKLTPVLVKAIQEQQELLETQEEMIEELQKQITELMNN